MGSLPGDSVAVRDIREGTVYFAWPVRVIRTEPDRLLTAQRPGAVGRVLRGYPGDLETMLAQMASGRPELVDLTWTRTITLSVFDQGAVWVPRLFWDAGTGHFLGYYVDFVRPLVFGAGTIDTCDLELDVVIAPNGAWRYKDEASYDRLRQLGWVSDADHEAIEAAKPIVTAAIESKRFPFDGSLVDWRWPEGLEPAVLSVSETR